MYTEWLKTIVSEFTTFQFFSQEEWKESIHIYDDDQTNVSNITLYREIFASILFSPQSPSSSELNLRLGKFKTIFKLLSGQISRTICSCKWAKKTLHENNTVFNFFTTVDLFYSCSLDNYTRINWYMASKALLYNTCIL